MSIKYVSAVDLDLRQTGEQAVIVVSLHLFGLLCVLVCPTRAWPVSGLLLLISVYYHWRRWQRWPWLRLVWKPQGTLLLIDRAGQAHSGQFQSDYYATRHLLIPTIRVADKTLRPMIFRHRQALGFRRLVTRLRCDVAAMGPFGETASQLDRSRG